MGKPFFTFKYKGDLHGCDSVCDLEVHKNLVICSERGDNDGNPSITNMAEQLATAICKQFDITPRQLIWIEHYPPEHNEIGRVREETFSLVFFNLTGGGILAQDAKAFEFSNPRWVSIEKVIVDALIDTHKHVEEPTIEEWTDGNQDFDEKTPAIRHA